VKLANGHFATSSNSISLLLKKTNPHILKSNKHTMRKVTLGAGVSEEVFETYLLNNMIEEAADLTLD
jgi:hypothetical protein